MAELAHDANRVMQRHGHGGLALRLAGLLGAALTDEVNRLAAEHFLWLVFAPFKQ
ncbi:hypothetical protein [Pseudomonas sp. DE0010]|uniref:hypothetical protein n=1 Tax=Pseudomonas sp. DE0010 TaxID=2584951 RepID=UPI001C497FBD|nr:hypothetical protein [Pseudomonas sp. DE0010]